MLAIRRDIELAGARDIPTLLERGEGAVSYVDAHHHIWRVQDLPWLSGPMIPRIFGPYESLRGGLPRRGVRRAGAPRTASRSRSTCRPTGRSSARWTRSGGCTRSTSETGWPDAIVGSADLFDPQAGATLEAQAKATPLMRGCRLQLHWHEHEAFRFAQSRRRMLDPVFNENLELVAELGWVFELQVFPNQLEYAERAARARIRS